MLRGIAVLALGAPRRVIGVVVLVFIAAMVLSGPLAERLQAGGYQDPSAGSAQATRLLAEKFGQTDQQLLITVTSAVNVDRDPARRVGAEIVDQLRQSPDVLTVVSPWTATAPQQASQLVSTDGRTGLIVANLAGGDENAPKQAKTLSDELVHDRDGVAVRAGGSAMVNSQINEQSQQDLILAESVAIPLSFIVLVWVFGGVFAAILPIIVGVVAIVGTMAMLSVTALVTDVSVFAMNLTTAMGLALAIDYTLLIISRYRDELADGVQPDQALLRTMQTAGRTVLYSAITVALSMAALVLFPMYFLKSFAYAGVATVAFAAAAAITVAPALIVWLGPRLDRLDVRRLLRPLLRRDEPVAKPVQQWFWYRSTRFFMRHAIPVGLAVTAIVIAVGAPFLNAKWGFADDRVLPESASAHQVGNRLRDGFAVDFSTTVFLVIPDADGLDAPDFDQYAAQVSQLPDVSSVTAPTATFVAGDSVGPPAGPTGIADGSAFLTVATTTELFSKASEAQLDRLQAVHGPGGRAVELAGIAQINRDSVDAITARLPLVLGVIAAITAILLFLVTGSVLLPIKTLILNLLSLSATYGALVWIFQEGHLGALGTTTNGVLMAAIPVLLFCIAFGLSMDYEVFLVARIREYWIQGPKTHAGNDEAVALGIAHTGRVITAAALIMSITFAALSSSQVSFMRMFGLGLTLAVLVDATLIRMVLVPAFMHVLGRINWWAPKPLMWLHKHVGIEKNISPVTGARRARGRHRQ